MTKSDIFHTDANYKNFSVDNSFRTLSKRCKLREDMEKRCKIQRPNSKKMIANISHQSTMKSILSSSSFDILNENTKKSTPILRETYGFTKKSKPLNISAIPTNTYDRIFKYGDFGHVTEKKRVNYKSKLFKNKRKDNINDLIKNQLKYRDKDDPITLKPNYIQFSSMVKTIKKNNLNRLLTDDN